MLRPGGKSETRPKKHKNDRMGEGVALLLLMAAGVAVVAGRCSPCQYEVPFGGSCVSAAVAAGCPCRSALACLVGLCIVE